MNCRGGGGAFSFVSRIQNSGTEDNNFVKCKGTFGPTDRNDQTGQSRSPPKVVPNITVGLNRKSPFHLISNWNFRNLELNGKHPNVLVPVYLRLFLPLQGHGWKVNVERNSVKYLGSSSSLVVLTHYMRRFRWKNYDLMENSWRK